MWVSVQSVFVESDLVTFPIFAGYIGIKFGYQCVPEVLTLKNLRSRGFENQNSSVAQMPLCSTMKDYREYFAGQNIACVNQA